MVPQINTTCPVEKKPSYTYVNEKIKKLRSLEGKRKKTKTEKPKMALLIKQLLN